MKKNRDTCKYKGWLIERVWGEGYNFKITKGDRVIKTNEWLFTECKIIIDDIEREERLKRIDELLK